MIENLYIKDYALIEELDVSFGSGLNIITGQTGAGKSIILGALNLVLGERADTDAIRKGASKAIAEATFRIQKEPSLELLLQEAAVEFEKSILIRREVRETGSRAFINDTPVSVSVLKKVGDRLVDLHGQHDHQLLLYEENHRMVLDSLESVRPSLLIWQESYRETMALRKELQLLRKRESELRQKQDLYRFQVNELDAAALEESEEEQLETEMRLLDNAEELNQKAAVIAELGSEGDPNVLDFLNRMKQALEDLSGIESGFESYLNEFTAAKISIEEAIRHTERYQAAIEFNPQRLEFLRARQAELRRLKKKYNTDTAGMIELLGTLRAELNLADNYELEIEKLNGRVEEAKKSLIKAGLNLFEARKRAGKVLSVALVQELSRLGIPHARFDVHMEWLGQESGWLEIDGRLVQPSDYGVSDVRFMISTNRGEELKPLTKTASGGEISRIMLALKSILAREQSLPVMIFDEIDIGISGAIADQVGKTMRDLSSLCQIIAITHLAQIACYAHHPYRVEKTESGGRSVTRIYPLDHENHIQELASLISGATITTASVASAKSMLAEVKR